MFNIVSVGQDQNDRYYIIDLPRLCISLCRPAWVKFCFWWGGGGISVLMYQSSRSGVDRSTLRQTPLVVPIVLVLSLWTEGCVLSIQHKYVCTGCNRRCLACSTFRVLSVPATHTRDRYPYSCPGHSVCTNPQHSLKCTHALRKLTRHTSASKWPVC